MKQNLPPVVAAVIVAFVVVSGMLLLSLLAQRGASGSLVCATARA